MTFPTSTGGTWVLTISQLEIWQETYPKVDVQEECGHARAWLLANPDRLKKNVPRFLVNWLKTASQRASQVARVGAYVAPRKAIGGTDYAEVEKAVYRRCILDGDTEEDARRIAKRVVEGMRK